MILILRLAAAAFLVAICVFALGVTGGLAGECRGQVVRTSYYGKETCNGRPPGKGPGTCHTANNIPFDGSQWLVAHKSLPFGTLLRLTYRGRSVTVPVEDRGPYIPSRTLDVSEAVAERLGMKQAGVALICMERVS